MGMHESVTLVTDLTAHEVATDWPADDLTWINNVRHEEGAVSCLLVSNVGDGRQGLSETLLDEFPSVERVAWTQLHNTSDSCVAEVYEHAPDHAPESIERVLRVSAGVGYWRLARDAVREQTGVPVQTWYELIDGESDIQTVPREETPY